MMYICKKGSFIFEKITIVTAKYVSLRKMLEILQRRQVCNIETIRSLVKCLRNFRYGKDGSIREGDMSAVLQFGSFWQLCVRDVRCGVIYPFVCRYIQ